MQLAAHQIFFGGARKPYKCELEYLQADGYSRLNSPVALNSTNLAAGVTIKMTLDVPMAGNNRSLLAQGPGTYSSPWCVCTTATAGEIKIFSNGKFQSSFSGLSGTTDVIVEVNSTTVYLNIGGTRKGGTYSTAYQYSDHLAILGYDGYSSGSSATYPAPSGTRLYAYKMYVGNNLVEDSIPVLDWSDVVCMYDRVSGALFYNAGTGNFVAGPEIVPVEYLESTGTQYIDTGVPTDSTGFSVDIATTKKAGNVNTRIFGIHEGNTRCGFALFGTTEPSGKDAFFGWNSAITFNATIPSRFMASLNYLNDRAAKLGSTTIQSNLGTLGSVTQSAYLLNANYNGAPFANQYVVGKLYGAEITVGSDVANNYKPIRVGSGSTWEGALLDTVERKVYRNMGTGAFAYGNDV